MHFKTNVLFYKIGYRRRDSNSLLFENKELAKNFTFLKPPFFHWVADPFVIDFNGDSYLFAECANIFTNKGHIRVLCLDSKKSKWRKVFVQKNHMSFPNVFERNGSFYCIPETNERNNIILYKSTKFPFEWKEQNILVKGGKYVDTIIINNDMFSYISNDSLYHYENIFDSCSFKKKYIDKKNNLRPAGNPFVLNGETLFPFQLNEHHYGGGVVFCKIENDSFVEIPKYRLTKEIMAENGVKECEGIHTYNFNSNYEVIDVLYKRFSFFGILGVITRKIFKSK